MDKTLAILNMTERTLFIGLTAGAVFGGTVVVALRATSLSVSSFVFISSDNRTTVP